MIMLDEVLSRLEGARRCAGGWVACCPAHDDHTPSLSICEGSDGRVLLHCFAGCCYQAIIAAFGTEAASEPAPRPIKYKPASIEDGERVELARRIWRESREAGGPSSKIICSAVASRVQCRGIGKWIVEWRLPSIVQSASRFQPLYVSIRTSNIVAALGCPRWSLRSATLTAR